MRAIRVCLTKAHDCGILKMDVNSAMSVIYSILSMWRFDGRHTRYAHYDGRPTRELRTSSTVSDAPQLQQKETDQRHTNDISSDLPVQSDAVDSIPVTPADGNVAPIELDLEVDPDNLDIGFPLLTKQNVEVDRTDDDIDINTLLYNNVNAAAVDFFIRLSEDDHLYYTLMTVLDPQATSNIGSFSGALAMDERVKKFSLLGVLSDILMFSKHRLLKKKDTVETNHIKDRLVVVAENMTKLRQTYDLMSYDNLKAKYHPLV